jgi:hypothetical protein
MRNKLVYFVMIGCLCILTAQASAAAVTLTASDAAGTSSFNSGTNWSDGLAPSAGNDYIVGNDLRLRTPGDGGSYTFGGDSLTINPDPTDDRLGLTYKGTGNTGSITIDNLILNGGSVNHLDGTGDVFNLYGNINVVADSIIRSKQGPTNVYSAISGSSQIAIHPSDSLACELTFFSSASTFTGNIVNTGRFTLADDAVLNFVIGANGVNNSFSGASTHTIFNGDFNIDLSGASSNIGDSWAIASSSPNYWGSTFSVVGFTDIGSDFWNKSANGVTYQFSEATGALTVVPEPASIVMILTGLFGVGLLWLRRK